MATWTLLPGDRFGAYEVVDLVGAGAMGEVYRARDLRLDRDVALKVLPRALQLDTERKARFEREARLLSSLNHPNIATVHGVETVNDSIALVMELVSGQTLAEMIAPGGTSASRGGRRHPIGVTAALRFAEQIAAALESAHERNIIHRDLKPANIKVRADGTVKVLDFGLAKVWAPDDPGDVTAATASDVANQVVGTPAYMSPEQARGGAVDRRTDIWAFGCVLYEMLTGEQLFSGQTFADTVATVLGRDPDLTALPEATPASIRSLLRRCLAKDPRQRLHDIGDARLEIADALVEPVATAVNPSAVVVSHRWRWVALAIGAVMLAVLAWTRIPHEAAAPPDPAEVTEVRLALPEAPFIPQLIRIQLSDDGSHFVYSSVLGMAVSATSTSDLVVLKRSRNEVADTILSPDGKSVAYFEGNSLKTMPVGGGQPVILVPAVTGVRTASWTSKGFLLMADDRGLFRVPEKGDRPTPVPLRPLSPGEGILYPVLMSDGRHVLCTVAETRGNGFPLRAAATDDARVEAIDIETGARTTLVNGGGFPAYLPTGHLVYLARGAIYARQFDLARLEASSDERKVVPDVAQFTTSANGTLLYVTGARSDLVWVDRASAEEQPMGIEPMLISYPRLSPSGRQIAIDGTLDNHRDIFLWDLTTKRRTAVTNDSFDNQLVAWVGPSLLVFGSRRLGGVSQMFIQSADGSGANERVLESANAQMPLSADAEGRLIFAEFLQRRDTNTVDTDILSVDLRSKKVASILSTPATEANAQVSPNGEWIAYQSDEESGSFQIYVQPYPVTTAGRMKLKISSTGGTQPLWSRDGAELFYRDFFGAVWAVPSRAPFSPARKILDARDYFGKGALLQGRTYDVASDGRLMMVKGQRQDLVLITNWTERLKRLVPIRP